MQKAIFEGLVYDIDDNPLQVAYVGEEAFYILDDQGFLRHIPAVDVDTQIWESLSSQIKGMEDVLSEQAAHIMGQDDIFSIAVIRSQMENTEKQFQTLQTTGIPQEARAYLNMMGFKVVVDFHGDVVQIHQPTVTDGDGEE